jgi:hypothetical protein
MTRNTALIQLARIAATAAAVAAEMSILWSILPK